MLSGDTENLLPVPRLDGKNVNLVALNMVQHLLPLWEAQTKYKETMGTEEDLIFKYTMDGPYSFQDFQDYLLKLLIFDDICPFVVEYKDKGESCVPVIVGAICYASIVPAHRKCELGHLWLDPRYRRRNIMDEAIYLLLRHAFEVAKYRRVQWWCYNDNDASKKLALRNNLKLEGVFRNFGILNGVSRDYAWFSMIDSEWEESKLNIESRIF